MKDKPRTSYSPKRCEFLHGFATPFASITQGAPPDGAGDGITARANKRRRTISKSENEQISRLVRAAIEASEESQRERSSQDLAWIMLRKIMGSELTDEPVALPRSIGEALLSDADWKKRLAGIVILRDYCPDLPKKDIRFVDQLRHVVDSDENEQVRAVALRTLGSVLRFSRDRNLGKLLATLAVDTSSALRIRTAAYIGLCLLHGVDGPLTYDDKELIQQVDPRIIHYYIEN
jgi:hypothetical protein